MHTHFKNALRYIEKYAVLFVFLFAVLYRLPHITHFVNDDDSLWKYRGYVFSTALSKLDFASTAVTYHPGVPLMWSQMFAIRTYGVLDDVFFHKTLVGRHEFFMNHLIQNIFLIVFTSVLITGIFVLLRRIFDLRFATAFMVVILLEPFFISLGRSIHNDMLVALTSYLSFLTVYLLYSRVSKKWKVREFFRSKLYYISGFVAALGLLTKSASLFLVPVFVSVASVFIILNRKFLKQYLSLLLLCIVISAVFFVLIWPAMWVYPLKTLWLYGYKGIFDTAITDGHLHYWFGKETMDPGFWFYPIVLVGRYTPVVVLMFILGIFRYVQLFIRSLKLKKISPEIRIIGLHLIYFFGYLAMITLSSKKLDRYTLPLLMPMIAVGIYGVRSLYPSVKKYKNILVATLCVVFLYHVLLLGTMHPNYLVYYSPFIGGLRHGKDIIEPKWVIGFDEVANYLNEINATSSKRIRVVTPDAHLLSYFADFKTIYPENVESDTGDFYVVPIFKQRTAESIIRQFHLTQDQVVRNILIAGVPYWSIYRVQKQ